MPHVRFALIFIAALVGAGITVLLFDRAGPAITLAALPVFLIAALALSALRR